MQRKNSFKFHKRNLCILILFITIYSMFSFIPQLMNKTYAATYTYKKSSNKLPSNFDTTYPGYKTLLQSLAKAHPNWTFKLYETGLNWETVINNEYRGHGSSPKNLSPATYPIGWICTICGDKKYDNGSWRCASRDAIEYMMDPRNSINESDVFQFQDLSSPEGDKNAIKSMVSGSFIDNEECINAILEAATDHKVSPYHLVSRILQEQGKKGSTLGLGITVAGGYKIDKTGKYAILTPKEKIATGSTTTRDGKKYTAITLGDVNGDGKVKATDYMKIKAYIMGTSKLTDTEKLAADVNEDGKIKATDYMKIKAYIMGTSNINVTGAVGGRKYYNLFNIGATGNSSSAIIENGLKRAQQEGWTSMASSIKGGAKFLTKNYIAVKQSTLYYQKFNVVNEASLYEHQYMQNILAAQNEGTEIRKKYAEYGILDAKYTFLIPLYKNMPQSACKKPATTVPIEDGELAYINVNQGMTLALRDSPNGKAIAYIDAGTKVSILKRAKQDEIVNGSHWDKVSTPKGTGYMAREASDGSKTYLVPIK